MNVTDPVLTGPRGLVQPHEIEPRRGSRLFDFMALAVILAGDAVAFQQLAARAMPDSRDAVVWALVLALSLAATVSMHYAGAAARARQLREAHPGMSWWLTLLLAWLALGGVSVWFRIAVPQPAASGGFGATIDTGAATHVPVAALLLMLYLVGGLCAYGIGFKMHNPARAAYFRARGAVRRAERNYSWTLWRLDRADAVPVWKRVWRWIDHRLAPSGSDAQDVANLPAARMEYPQTGPAPEPQQQAAWRPADELGARRRRAERRAHAQAEQLRQVARHRLAVALQDPASSTGVFASCAVARAAAPQNDEGHGS